MKIGEAVSTGASRLSTELSNAVTEAAATVQNIVDQSETLVNELKALPQDIDPTATLDELTSAVGGIKSDFDGAVLAIKTAGPGVVAATQGLTELGADVEKAVALVPQIPSRLAGVAPDFDGFADRLDSAFQTAKSLAEGVTNLQERVLKLRDYVVANPETLLPAATLDLASFLLCLKY